MTSSRCGPPAAIPAGRTRAPAPANPPPPPARAPRCSQACPEPRAKELHRGVARAVTAAMDALADGGVPEGDQSDVIACGALLALVDGVAEYGELGGPGAADRRDLPRDRDEESRSHNA